MVCLPFLLSIFASSLWAQPAPSRVFPNSVVSNLAEAGFTHSNNNPLLNGVENSILLDGNVCDNWFRNTDSKIYYSSSTDDKCEIWASSVQITVPNITYFPYVFQLGSIYYMVGTNLLVDDNLYLATSTDKVTWGAANSGNPILTHSSNPSDWYYYLFNPAIAVEGSVWHLLVEGRSGTSDFQTGYSSSTLADGPNFNANISTSPVLPGLTGNPYLISVPNRNALLAVYGSLDDTHTWTLKTSVAHYSENLKLPAAWITAPGFSYSVSGVHIADPSIVFNTGTIKSWGSILQYNYDQLSTYQAFSYSGIDRFYDWAMNPYESVTPGFSAVRVYPVPYRPNGGNPDQGKPYSLADQTSGIIFDNLPEKVTLKIYTLSGQLVTTLDSAGSGGSLRWDARNDDGQDVATGGYLAVLGSPGHSSIVRKLLIIR